MNTLSDQHYCPLCGHGLVKISTVTEETVSTGRVRTYAVVQCVSKREHMFKIVGKAIYGMNVRLYG